MVLILRSLIFDFCFYIFSAVFFIFFFPFIVIFKREFTVQVYAFYAKILRYLCKKILNLTFEIKGEEYLNSTKAPYIVALEHQSAFDTFIPHLLFKNFVVVLKNELFYVPFFGMYLKRLDSIFIKRKERLKALKYLIKEGQKSFQNGRNILIYPQGTRALWNEPSKCQAGVFILYNQLKCPVIPVTVDSGKFWPRKTFLKQPGEIKIEIHSPILPGSKKDDFLDVLNGLYDQDHS